MTSLLKSTLNTRPLLKDSLRYIRSDAPVNISQEETQWLLDHGIRMLVDLRTDAQVQAHPVPIARDDRFIYCRMPVTGGARIPESPTQIADSYLRMADDRMAQILQTITSASSGVMYFCTAGKDRTGIVSALLLRHLGFSDEEIIQDYLLSAEMLAPLLKRVIAENPSVDPAVFIPRRETMERFLREVPARFAAPTVTAICGRLCSGKSTYTAKLCSTGRYTVLSVDDTVLPLFGRMLGYRHQEITDKVKNYLLQQSLALLHAGVNVVLDWGFWRRADRESVRTWYAEHGYAITICYLDITEEEWQRRVRKRNADILAGRSDAYYVDDALAEKFTNAFEPPCRDEIDVWIEG